MLSVRFWAFSHRSPIHSHARYVLLIGELEKLLNLADGETQRARSANEAEPSEMLRRVCPVVALGSRRRCKQSNAFIVANRLDLGSGRFRELSDAEWFDGHLG